MLKFGRYAALLVVVLQLFSFNAVCFLCYCYSWYCYCCVNISVTVHLFSCVSVYQANESTSIAIIQRRERCPRDKALPLQPFNYFAFGHIVNHGSHLLFSAV